MSNTEVIDKLLAGLRQLLLRAGNWKCSYDSQPVAFDSSMSAYIEYVTSNNVTITFDITNLHQEPPQCPPSSKI